MHQHIRSNKSAFTNTTPTVSTLWSSLWSLNVPSSPTIKLNLHVTVGILLFASIIFGVVKLASGGATAATNVIGQCLKSYVFMLYIALSERHPRFKKWASPKTYAVLSSLEILFWVVTLGLAVSGATKRGCAHKIGCIAADILVVLCLFIFLIFNYSTYIYVRDFRRLKRGEPAWGEDAVQKEKEVSAFNGVEV